MKSLMHITGFSRAAFAGCAFVVATAFWPSDALAQSIGLYLSPPGQQNTTRPGSSVESFNRGAGAIGASGAWSIANYTASTGALANADQYGGAGGTGQYLSVQGGPINVTLTGQQKYVGFWWSAGDNTNIIRFYDTANNLLAEFTTATLVALLSGTGSITAIDGNRYPKVAYRGNPNPPAGRNSLEPYGYVNLVLEGSSTSFGRIEIRGSNFELDNLAVAGAVPIDPAWVDYGSLNITTPPGAIGATDDSVATTRGTPVSSTVATNDTTVPGSTFAPLALPANGNVAMLPDGSYTYTPNPGFSGKDTFTYQQCKPTPDQTTCVTATVTVTVAPEAVDDTDRTAQDTTLNASVATNDAVLPGSNFTLTGPPPAGTFNLATDGSYTFTPPLGATGVFSFDYTVCLPAPNAALCDTATATITVTPQTVPVAANVAVVGTPQAGHPISGSYSYSDVQGDLEALSTVRWVRSPTTSPGGGVDVSDARSYTPVPGDVGSYLFYCVTPVADTGLSPGLEVCSPAVAVQPENTVPVASNVTIGGVPQQGVPLTGSYNYADSESDTQGGSTFRWVRSPSNTTAVGGVGIGASTSYTPVAADVGQYLFFCVTPHAATGATPGTEVCTVAGNGGTPTAVLQFQPTAIPTLSEWGMLVLSALMALGGWFGLRRRGGQA